MIELPVDLWKLIISSFLPPVQSKDPLLELLTTWLALYPLRACSRSMRDEYDLRNIRCAGNRMLQQVRSTSVAVRTYFSTRSQSHAIRILRSLQKDCSNQTKSLLHATTYPSVETLVLVPEILMFQRTQDLRQDVKIIDLAQTKIARKRFYVEILMADRWGLGRYLDCTVFQSMRTRFNLNRLHQATFHAELLHYLRIGEMKLQTKRAQTRFRRLRTCHIFRKMIK